jgi:hypothetical protein
VADQVVVRETLSVTSVNVTEEDKALGFEYNRLAWMALKRAELYLQFGPERERLAVVKSFLASTAKLSSLESKSQIDESRTALFNVLDQISAVEEVRPVVTALDILNAASTETVAGRPDNQDDI